MDSRFSPSPASTAGQSVARAAFRTAFPHTIPMLLGFLFLGIGCGVFAHGMGLAPWVAPVMAAAIFGGSLEFVAVSLLLSPFAPFQVLILALVIQSRHLFYGISLLEKYRGMGWKKPFLLQFLCDETFAINYSVEVPFGIDRGWFYWWVSILNYLYWVAGVALGSAFGTLVQFPMKGLDFIMTSLFAVIFVEQWLREEMHVSSLVGLAACLGSLAVWGPDHFLLPSLGLILVALTLLRRPLRRYAGERKVEGP